MAKVRKEKGILYIVKSAKKIGLFEEMSPYGHKWWFTYNPYRHKDCGGWLYVMLDHYCRPISTERWQAMSPEEKEAAIREHWESEARCDRAHEEYVARMNAMPYEERKALDKEISDFRK